MLVAAPSRGKRCAVPSRLVDWGSAICTVLASPSAPGGYGCSAPTLTAPGNISTSCPITRPLCSSVFHDLDHRRRQHLQVLAGSLAQRALHPRDCSYHFCPHSEAPPEPTPCQRRSQQQRLDRRHARHLTPPRGRQICRAMEDAPNCPALQRTRQALLEMDGRWELLRAISLPSTVHWRHHRRPIWKTWAPSNAKIFLLLASLNRCWTADRRARHNLPHDPICKLCSQDNETLHHLLVGCVFSHIIWHDIMAWCRIPALLPDGTSGFFDWWMATTAGVPAASAKGRTPSSSSPLGHFGNIGTQFSSTMLHPPTTSLSRIYNRR